MEVGTVYNPKLFDESYLNKDALLTISELLTKENDNKKPVYQYENGYIYEMDCVDFLKQIPNYSADTVFADPPYNIKKAVWDNIGDTDQYINWSMKWIQKFSRI